MNREKTIEEIKILEKKIKYLQEREDIIHNKIIDIKKQIFAIKYPFKIGDLIRDKNRNPNKVYKLVDYDLSGYWVFGYLRKKDGTFSTVKRIVFSPQKVEEDI